MIRLMFLVAMFTLGSGTYVALRARQWVLGPSLALFTVLMCINFGQIVSVLSGGES